MEAAQSFYFYDLRSRIIKEEYFGTDFQSLPFLGIRHMNSILSHCTRVIISLMITVFLF